MAQNRLPANRRFEPQVFWSQPIAVAIRQPVITPVRMRPGSLHPSPEQYARMQQVWRAIQRAERLLEQNKLDAAEQAGREAARLSDPRALEVDVSLRSVLAGIYERQGNYHRAAALFGFHAEMNLNAAIALVKTGRWEEARKSYKDIRILTYHPDFKPYLPPASDAKSVEAAIFLQRGIVDVDERRPAGALWALEHAVRLLPRNPLALWQYGRALTANQQATKARSYYEAAIRADTRGPIAAQARLDLAKKAFPGRRIHD